MQEEGGGVAAKSSVSLWIIITMHNCERGEIVWTAHMCRIPVWHPPWQPSRTTPASTCRLPHSLSANPDHFPPPRHPDPDWTWCTPGIDLAWLGLAALTWFGPKLLAWPRHPAPRPPSAPTGGGGGLPFLLPILPLYLLPHPPPPPCRQELCQGQATQCHPGEAHGRELQGKGLSLAQCVRFLCCARDREKKEKYSLRTWQRQCL